MAILFRMLVLGVVIAATSNVNAGKPNTGGTTGGSTTSPGAHIMANPNDYFLPGDTTLYNNEDMSGSPATTPFPKGTKWYQVPDIERLRAELAAGVYSGAEMAAKQQIVDGYDITTKTYQMIGKARTDGKPPLFNGQVMNCSTCHAQGGTVPYAWPFTRTYSLFGDRTNQSDPVHEGEKYAPLGYWRDTTTVNRDCGINCAGQGHIPVGSDEMLALNAWIKAVTDGIYPGEGILIPQLKLKVNNTKIPGARNAVFPRVLNAVDPVTGIRPGVAYQADPKAGKTAYDRTCAACHGKDGLGKWNDKDGYTVPPVAGPGSHTKAGGPYMAPVFAAFIKRNMPLSKPGSLTEQDALNIAVYLTDLPRDSRWWEDFYYDHNPCGRPAYLPLDVGVTPAGFDLQHFTPNQVKYGPWQEINEWLKSDDCKINNPVADPVLPENFNYGYVESVDSSGNITGNFSNIEGYVPNHPK